MAKINIRNMDRIEKTRNIVHEEATATYTVFKKDNETYFQIDTYGTNNRQFIAKASQIIQIDRTDAISLISLLKKEFNL